MKGTTLFDCNAYVSTKAKIVLFLFVRDLYFLPDMEKQYAKVFTNQKITCHRLLIRRSLLQMMEIGGGGGYTFVLVIVTGKMY